MGITKIEDNYVVKETIVKTADKILTEKFDQERLNNEITKAQEDLTKAQTRIDELALVQTEMDKELEK